MKELHICLLVAVFCSLLSPLAYSAGRNDSVLVIGQDTKSINDYMDVLSKDGSYPDGIMAYAAINDLRGLWEPVDQGGGINYVDQLLQKYPQMHVVQIGLYMRYMLGEIIKGSFDNNIDQLGQWIKGSGKQVYLRIGYEFDNPENEYDPEQYKKAYRYIVDRLKGQDIHNVYFVWHTIAWKAKDWPAYEPLKWYPGDQYVDWVGISFLILSKTKSAMQLPNLPIRSINH